MNRKTYLTSFLAILTACSMLLAFSSCKNRDTVITDVESLADSIWTFSMSHPDGFTLDICTMTEPMEGIAVSYAETQGSHSREQLPKVIVHALSHDGYVGGWLDTEDSLYYFDSSRLFPEDSLEAAIRFGRENEQYTVYIISTGTTVEIDEQSDNACFLENQPEGQFVRGH